MTNKTTALRMVPDKHYQYYDAGRPFPSRTPATNVITGPCFRNVCMWLSFVAVGFLLFVGMLLESQPLYIKGVKPAAWVKAKQQSDEAAYPYDASEQQLNRQQQLYADRPNSHDLAMTAYRAMWAYLFTALLCISYGWRCWSYLSFGRRAGYRDIPDHDSTIPVFHQITETTAARRVGTAAPSPMWTRTMFLWRKSAAWLERNYRHWTRRQRTVLPTHHHHHAKRHQNRPPSAPVDSSPTVKTAPGRRVPTRRRGGKGQGAAELPMTADDLNYSSKDR